MNGGLPHGHASHCCTCIHHKSQAPYAPWQFLSTYCGPATGQHGSLRRDDVSLQSLRVSNIACLLLRRWHISLLCLSRLHWLQAASTVVQGGLDVQVMECMLTIAVKIAELKPQFLGQCDPLEDCSSVPLA